jgi:hypothetical protein
MLYYLPVDNLKYQKNGGETIPLTKVSSRNNQTATKRYGIYKICFTMIYKSIHENNHIIALHRQNLLGNGFSASRFVQAGRVAA